MPSIEVNTKVTFETEKKNISEVTQAALRVLLVHIEG